MSPISMRRANVVGLRFHRLVVVREVEPRGTQRYVECLCDCGKTKTFHLGNLRKGGTKSCGCLRAERVAAAHRKHGHIRRGVASPTYNAWANMRGKCHSPSHIGYSYFGARGITVCDEWRASFVAFLRDVGERPAGCGLVLNPGATVFAPGACKWAPR